MATYTKNNKIRWIAGTGVLTAVAFVLMMLEFSVPLVPSFLKFDFSDLPAFIASFAYGPLAGVVVELLKNLIHLPFSHTSGVGELANFIVGACFVFPAGVVYYFIKNRKGALIGCLLGTIFSAGVSYIVNVYITYPFYINAFHMSEEGILSMYVAALDVLFKNASTTINTLPKALLLVNVPFTLIKGIINSILTFLVYKRISPILKGYKKKKQSVEEESNNP